MNIEKAKEIIGADNIKENGNLYNPGRYLFFAQGDKSACLDDEFTADELEAIAVYMRSKST